MIAWKRELLALERALTLIRLLMHVVKVNVLRYKRPPFRPFRFPDTYGTCTVRVRYVYVNEITRNIDFDKIRT